MCRRLLSFCVTFPCNTVCARECIDVNPSIAACLPVQSKLKMEITYTAPAGAGGGGGGGGGDGGGGDPDEDEEEAGVVVGGGGGDEEGLCDSSDL